MAARAGAAAAAAAAGGRPGERSGMLQAESKVARGRRWAQGRPWEAGCARPRRERLPGGGGRRRGCSAHGGQAIDAPRSRNGGRSPSEQAQQGGWMQLLCVLAAARGSPEQHLRDMRWPPGKPAPRLGCSSGPAPGAPAPPPAVPPAPSLPSRRLTLPNISGPGACYREEGRRLPAGQNLGSQVQHSTLRERRGEEGEEGTSVSAGQHGRGDRWPGRPIDMA